MKAFREHPNSQAARLPPQDHRQSLAATLLKLFLFDFVVWAWLGVFFDTLSFWRFVLGVWVIGPAALILWEVWRARRELREMAFMTWVDQLRARCRQYDITFPEGTRWTYPCWRERWRRGLTPQAAINEELGRGEYDLQGQG